MGAKTLRTLSVVGEALHFSSRRFETVLRVSVLPIALLLILNMAAAFAYLSVANNRIVTFRDVAAAGLNWAQTAKIANAVALKGLGDLSEPIWIIYLASASLTLVLVASFMAPLIRYAGLGERPAQGVLRVAFGPAQLRFIGASSLSFLLVALIVYAPISAATFIVIGVIATAMQTPYAHFPDAGSLHTVDLIPGRDAIAMRGDLWLYEYGYWGGGALLIAALLAIVLIFHIRPRAEDRTAGIGLFWRAAGVSAGLTLLFGVLAMLAITVGGLSGSPVAAQTLSMMLLAATAIAAALFLNLRLYPYAGVAVCRGRMGFARAFGVTRRFNLFRLALALALIAAILVAMEILLVIVGGVAALAMLGSVAAAVESYLKLSVGAEAATWVKPFFGWLWAVVNIGFALVWTAFTYGVSAGLWGRLYRESER